MDPVPVPSSRSSSFPPSPLSSTVTSPQGSPAAVFAARLALIAFGADGEGVDDEAPGSVRSLLAPNPSSSGNLYAEDGSDEPSAAGDLLREGNAAFASQQFEQAIELYSRALLAKPGLNAFLLLSNRCAAFCSLSRRLREIPAAQSEQKALYGLDPTSLAQLALRDAEKVLKLVRDWPKAYYRKATAQTLLEQYEAAREAFLEGLQIDPLSKLLRGGLTELGADDEDSGGSGGGGEAPRLTKRRRTVLQHMDEFDCSLCLKLLFHPVTTPCGHSFCRGCLVRALDHGNKCPVCRTVLFVSARSYPVSVTLQTILEKQFPAEYEERREEMEAVPVVGREVLPMFVMDVVLPGQKMALNIFEPRYRLMVRRCMEGDHRMGMVGIDSATRQPADVACEVDIRECEPLPDGRFYLEVEGRRRCKIVRSWEQDGYRVGEVEWMLDQAPPTDSDAAKQVEDLATSAADLSRAWVGRLHDAARSSRRGRLAEVVRQAGDMPPPTQSEHLSFWVANLLPVGSDERLTFLRTQDTSERLQREIEYLRAEHSPGCRQQ
eukprot:TRINITY_DN1915_c0_g1_i1.p1 TRINITY_DN1915_c0_g1~~TRINITY_DN1915_c0_g1_i1.p1  ORF type:complete len:548 (-),score=94.81 TRINITY_DN1915_c0_g1_i1:134-1777(-)